MKKLIFVTVLLSILCVNIKTALCQVWDVGDYSQYKTASQYLEAYPDQENFANYPEFSWDKVARWAILRSADGFDSVDIRGLAQNYQLVAFEKSNPQGLSSSEAGTIKASERLKAVNPNMKTVFYWNTVVAYGGYEANSEYLPNAWEWSQHTIGSDGQDTFKVIRGFLNMYDSNVPELRRWWVKTAANVVSNPAVDGVFIDKVGDYSGAFFDENGEAQTNYIKMLDSLDKVMPDTALYLGNIIRNERWNGNREHFHYAEGSYLERMDFIFRSTPASGQTEADARAVNLQLMREMGTKGKIVLWKLGPGHSHIQPPADQSRENMIQYYKDAVEYSLALYLISAEKYTYIAYTGTVDADDETYLYLTDYIPELNRPLGEPLGPPTKDGYIYTRSFKYVDVWLNIQTEECELTWRDPVPDPSLAVSGFTTYPNSLWVKTKSSEQIGTSFSPLEAGNTKVIWSSSDSTIASVDSSGLVTGHMAGFVTVVGTSEDGSFTDKTWVTVIKDLIGIIPPGVNIAPYGTASQSSTDFGGDASRAIDDNIVGAYNQSSVTHTASETNPWWQVDLGDEYTIGHIKLYGRTDECCKDRLSDYTVYVLNANGDTTFSHSYTSFPDPYEILDVGEVTGNRLLVQLNKVGALSLAEVQVFILPIEVTGLEIDDKSVTIQLEESHQLNAVLSPADATFQDINWSSSKTSVATVNSTGLVSAVGIGSARITATSLHGDFTAISNITVTGIPVTSISISPESVNLYPGDTIQLTSSIVPDNATDTTVRWSSNNANVASVSTTGLLIAHKIGAATILARSSSVEIIAECEIIVNSIQVSGVSVAPDTASLYVGDTLRLESTLSPLNATNQAVFWDSDDISVATVDTEGLLTAISEGTAIVSATSEDGGFKDESVIVVNTIVGINELMTSSSDFDWEGAKVEIYNTYGMLISKNFVSNSTLHQQLDDLPDGHYVIRAVKHGKVACLKGLKIQDQTLLGF